MEARHQVFSHRPSALGPNAGDAEPGSMSCSPKAGRGRVHQHEGLQDAERPGGHLFPGWLGGELAWPFPLVSAGLSQGTPAGIASGRAAGVKETRAVGSLQMPLEGGGEGCR